MRRRSLVMLMLFCAIIAFGQRVDIVQSRQLPLGEISFQGPLFNPDGKQLLLTQYGFQGLWLYDLSKESLIQLNDLSGAGYEPKFTRDGKKIIFRTDEYINKRRYSSLVVQDVNNLETRYLTEKTHHLSPAIFVADDQLVYKTDKNIKSIQLNDERTTKSTITNEIYGYIDNGKIIIHKNGQQSQLEPVENSDYIWFSLSPDKTKFVFTVVGGNTFISDLEGNLIMDLGRANAPKWASDGEWIVYMVDDDDGHVIISSDIWVYHIESQTKEQLTKTDDIHEMYPVWSSGMDKIACVLTSGKIAILDVRVKD